MNARTLQRSVTLPDLFVIRIGTAKGTASHEMMHERVGSTRPNTAGGGRERGGGEGREERHVFRWSALRNSRRSEERVHRVLSRAEGRWEILGEAEEEKARNRFLSSRRGGNNGGIYFNSVIPLFSMLLQSAPPICIRLNPLSPC